MQKILIRLIVGILNLIYLFLSGLQLQEKVTIISRQSDEPTLDIRLLTNCLMKQGVHTVVLTKTLKKTLPGVVKYCFQMLEQMYHIATSKVVVIDGYCILVSVLRKKRNQKVIQMWHALGAIKKFGWQNVDNPDGHTKAVAEAMRMHRNYDYVLAPSKITGRFFAEAFRIPKNKIIYYGLPRIDFLKAVDKHKESQMIARYPEVKEKESILYVPTFRKHAELDLKRLIAGFDFGKFNLIIKKHFLDQGDYSWAKRAGAIVDDNYTSMEWLRICSKVITDYSAMAFEAAILDRELYIYQPDITAYEHNVGLNVDLSKEAIGEYVCTSEKQLFDLLRKTYRKDAIIEFRQKYMEIELDDCTRKLCSFIQGLLVK